MAMQKIIPALLKEGDEIRIIAPSRGTKIIGQETRTIARQRLEKMGFKVTFAQNAIDENWDMTGSTTIEKRVADIHDAFRDNNVKAIFTIIGGANSNQLLPHLDYNLIKNNPKFFCGFSDITALLNAIYAKTGLITFSGPHFSSLGMKKGCEYTIANLQTMLTGSRSNKLQASEEWSDDLWFLDQDKRTFIKNDGHWIINEGHAEGTLIGGNLGTFNLLLGSQYRPEFLENTILFIEDTEGSDILDFERNLQALLYQPDFKNVKGLLIGRFQKGSNVNREQLEFIIKNKTELADMPIIANLDFGHSTPLLTLPIGGYATVNSDEITVKVK